MLSSRPIQCIGREHACDKSWLDWSAVRQVAQDDPVCRRLMSMLGIGCCADLPIGR